MSDYSAGGSGAQEEQLFGLFGRIGSRSAAPRRFAAALVINGAPAFRCSGTLLSSTVFLTAGHCAGEPGEFSGMRVFTESDVQNGNNDYPFAGPNSVEAA